MGFKLGDVSPVVGMFTGEGMTGNLIRQGVGGILPSMIARDAYDSKQQSIAGEKAKEDEKNAQAAQAAAQESAMVSKQQKAEQAKNYVSRARETGGLEEYKSYKKGGKVKMSSASKRADGIAVKGKTRGRIV